MALFIGIEGSGSGRTAVATDENGRELARVPGERGMLDVRDPTGTAGALSGLARKTAQTAGVARIEALCCGLAGFGREPEQLALEEALAATGVAECLRVTTDAEAAMADSFGPKGTGILLIAGTGSIAWGRDNRGKTARVGGWGLLLGDEGSGYGLGLAALRAVVRAHDGRGQPSTLTAAVLQAAGVDAPEGLVPWSAAASKGDIAALASLVVAAAAAADIAAKAILDNAAHELGMHVLALNAHLGPWSEPPVLALAGALLAPGSPLRVRVLKAVERLLVHVRPLERGVDSAMGAAALARVLA